MERSIAVFVRIARIQTSDSGLPGEWTLIVIFAMNGDRKLQRLGGGGRGGRTGTMDLLIFLICTWALALLAGVLGVTSSDFVVSVRAMKEVSVK